MKHQDIGNVKPSTPRLLVWYLLTKLVKNRVQSILITLLLTFECRNQRRRCPRTRTRCGSSKTRGGKEACRSCRSRRRNFVSKADAEEERRSPTQTRRRNKEETRSS